MLKIKKQPYDSVWISADSQKELGETFIRFQEYYESPYKQFKNKIFTLGSIKNWYSQIYGADIYSTTWVGFNFPSSVLKPFKEGLFDPLTPLEKELLNLLKYRNDDYYIIGAQNASVLKHELCHAMYGYSKTYKKEIDCFIRKHQKSFAKICSYILKKGYDKSVLYDEIQAYVLDNDDEYILSNLNSNLINQIHKIYDKYKQKTPR